MNCKSLSKCIITVQKIFLHRGIAEFQRESLTVRNSTIMYYYYGLLYSVEACFLTLNSVNKTTLPGYNTEPRRSVAEFVQESIIF